MSSNAFTLLLSLLHFGLASAVTVHALLTRLAPQSTIAWIGLAWLSPYIGPVLYFLFGVNRVRRKAIKLTGPDGAIDSPLSPYALPPEAVERRSDSHLEPLAKFGQRLTGRPLLDGNALTPLIDGVAAYPAMIAAIEAAERSVALCSFIFHDDAGGWLAELVGHQAVLPLAFFGAAVLAWCVGTYNRLRRARELRILSMRPHTPIAAWRSSRCAALSTPVFPRTNRPGVTTAHSTGNANSARRMWTSTARMIGR